MFSAVDVSLRQRAMHDCSFLCVCVPYLKAGLYFHQLARLGQSGFHSPIFMGLVDFSGASSSKRLSSVPSQALPPGMDAAIRKSSGAMTVRTTCFMARQGGGSDGGQSMLFLRAVVCQLMEKSALAFVAGVGVAGVDELNTVAAKIGLPSASPHHMFLSAKDVGAAVRHSRLKNPIPALVPEEVALREDERFSRVELLFAVGESYATMQSTLGENEMVPWEEMTLKEETEVAVRMAQSLSKSSHAKVELTRIARFLVLLIWMIKRGSTPATTGSKLSIFPFKICCIAFCVIGIFFRALIDCFSFLLLLSEYCRWNSLSTMSVLFCCIWCS